MKTGLAVVLLCFAVLRLCAGQRGDSFPFAITEKFDKANVFGSERYSIWGTNIIKGRDGRYHAIYSRWPKTRGHLAWVSA